MKKLKDAMVAIVAMAVLLIGMAVTGTFDRQAEGKPYVVHGTFDGYQIVTDDGHVWDYEADVLTWETLNIKGEPSFYEFSSEDMYHKVEPNTLVHVRFNDNATPDDITDDIPLVVAYDRSGMHDRLIAEIDAFLISFSK